MAVIGTNEKKLYDVGLEPAALVLLENRFPVEKVLLASIAVSLHKIAKAMSSDNDFPDISDDDGNIPF